MQDSVAIALCNTHCWPLCSFLPRWSWWITRHDKLHQTMKTPWQQAMYACTIIPCKVSITACPTYRHSWAVVLISLQRTNAQLVTQQEETNNATSNCYCIKSYNLNWLELYTQIILSCIITRWGTTQLFQFAAHMIVCGTVQHGLPRGIIESDVEHLHCRKTEGVLNYTFNCIPDRVWLHIVWEWSPIDTQGAIKFTPEIYQ